MNNIIIYGSHYGTTRRYAMELSKRIDCLTISYEDIKHHDLSQYQTVIHLGGLYAGGVLGLLETVKLLNNEQNLFIVTIGLADVKVQSNIDSIKQSIQRQISKELYEKAKVVHLRGGIDYSKLSFKHRTMMMFLVNKVKKIPAEQRSAEEHEFIDTYNQIVDFVDLEALDEVIQLLK